MPTPRKTKSKKTKTSTGTSKKTKTAGRKTTSRTAKASASKKTAKKTKTSSKAAGTKKTKTNTKATSAKKTKTKVVKKTTSTKTASKPKAAATKTASKPKAAATKAASKPKKTITTQKAAPVEAIPDRSHLDAEFLATMRAALVAQRERLLSVVKSTRAQMAEKSNALPDVSDQAAEGYGDELAVGLIAIEAAQLDDIEAAIERIDNGTYGLCEDTGKPIPKKRLEVLPFVRRCLEAEQAREHRARTQSGYVDDDD